MEQHSSMRRAVARATSFVRSPRLLFGLLCLMLALPDAAFAAVCPDFVVPDAHTTPSTSPMASGGTIRIDVSSCDASFGISGMGSGPTHGTASADVQANIITYTNNGDGFTSDAFTFIDSEGGTVNVTVNIGPATPSITISPSTLPTPAPKVGTAYTGQLTASGGSTPYTYAVSSGALPRGLNLNTSSGQISGTPNQAASFSFTVTATDSASHSGSQTYSGSVADPSSGIVIAQPPAATVNTAYSTQLAASGANAPYTYALASGSLPANLSLTAAGVLSGTPTAAGTYTFSVRATDNSPSPGGPYSNVTSLTLTVNDVPPVANNVNVIVAYNSTNNPMPLNFSGGGTPTSVSITGAPAHGAASVSGTTITYTPTATYAGSDSFTYTGTNGAGTSTPATMNITVAQPAITFSPSAPDNGQLNVAYSQALGTASGGTGPYTYTIASGRLPNGMGLNTNTDTLGGTPTESGSFVFTIRATDSSTGSGPFSAVSGSLTLTVVTVPGAPVNVSATAGTGQATVTYAAPASNGGSAITGYTIRSTPGNFTASSTGASPSPIVVSGLSNGTSYTFTVTATNAQGNSADSTPSNAVTPKAAQTITFNNPGTQIYNSSPTFTASSTSGLGVTFSSLSPGVCTVGTSSGTVTFTSTGNCTIQADQAGDGTYAPAPSVQQTFLVQPSPPGAPTIGTATAGNNGQATVSFTAPASNGGAPITGYTVTASGGTPIATGPGSPITITGLTNGTSYTFTVTATNSGGTGAASATSNAVTPRGTQTITFNNPGSVDFGTTTTLNGTASSGLAIIYTSQTTNICTVSGNQLTARAPGNCTIHANQPGDTTWEPAPEVIQTFAVVVPGGAPNITTTTLPAATGGTPYSQRIGAAGGAAPYSFNVSAGALPTGTTMDSSGLIAGTPVVSGTFPFTVQVTDQAGQTASRPLQLQVNAPGISMAPGTLPPGVAGTPYAPQTLTASGGSAPYTYAVSAGALPSGMSLSQAGVLSGTPAAAASATFTVTVTDHFGFSGARGYTLVVGEPAPVVVNDTANTGANVTVSVPVTSNDTGPITSIAVAQAPAHGTASVNGLNLVYVPAHDFFGIDTLTYTATGPGGTSSPATVTITVAAGAVPVAVAKSATLLAGKSITIHAAEGAANGPFTALTIVTQPVSGSVTVEGTDAVYTAAADASGQVNFDYTLSNVFGASTPVRATINVNPMPVAPALTASAMAGTQVTVDLTADAHGGPFTGANLLAIEPANAGAATVHATANGYSLTFTAAATFSGSARLSYTLTNAYATSAAGSVTVAVTQRSDPSKDAEVTGILSAQADATRRMAVGQISNFQRRLEMLHSGGVTGFSNGLTFASAGSQRGKDAYADLRNQRDDASRRYLVQPDPDNAPAATGRNREGGSLPGDVAVWTGGAVNFGRSQPGTSGNGTDFTTSGVSFGVDKQFSQSFALGVGVGYGHDNSDVGNHGSRSAVDSYNMAVYASYHPTDAFYTDALIGYQWLSFDARRYLTDTGGRVHGSRDGKQLFGSFSIGYLYRVDGTQLTPYGRLDIARARLDGYTEHGDDFYALSYQHQTVKTSTATLGFLAQWSVKRDYGIWAPQLRAEFGHDMQGASEATMRYADLSSGPLYRATLQQQSREHTLLGAGIALQTLRGWLLRAEYQLQLDNSSRDNQSILLGIEKKFGP